MINKVEGSDNRERSYLCLPSIALMAGDADFIEQAMQLANYGVDLLGQVTGIHVVGWHRFRARREGRLFAARVCAVSSTLVLAVSCVVRQERMRCGGANHGVC